MQNLKRIVFSGCLGLLCVFAVQAKGKKGKGDGDANGPPKGDPSAFGPLNFDELPEGLPPANGGAFEGGETGSSADANANNSISEEEQQENGRFDVPTNGAPSPLFSAQPFTQQMLRFEEFGSEPLKLKGKKPKKSQASHRGRKQGTKRRKALKIRACSSGD